MGHGLNRSGRDRRNTPIRIARNNLTPGVNEDPSLTRCPGEEP